MSNIPSSVFVYIWDTCETGDCYRCRPSVSENVCYRSPFDRLIDDLTYETLGRIYAVAAQHGNVRSRENTARTGGRHTLGEYSFVARKICQIGMKYMKLFYTSIGGVILHAYHILRKYRYKTYTKYICLNTNIESTVLQSAVANFNV